MHVLAAEKKMVIEYSRLITMEHMDLCSQMSGAAASVKEENRWDAYALLMRNPYQTPRKKD